MIPQDPTERDALAAEYVLGTLEARRAREVEAALEGDAGLAALIAEWERRLAPLSLLAEPEAPPPELWDRIERALASAPPRPAAPADGLVAGPAGRLAAWWRRWAIGASAVAAGLAGLLVWQPLAPRPEPLTTVLLTTQEQSAWVVQADRERGLRLAAVNPQPAPPDRAWQLWALPQGATAPTSLGLVTGQGAVSVSAARIRPEPGMLIEITLEPPGGSPTGRPTGPILFIGRLSAAGSS